jgi:hypothetical protein
MSHADLQAARKALRELTDAPKPVSRTTFNAWDAIRQSLFCAAGGKITNDPMPPRRGSVPQAVVPMTRADYIKADLADRVRSMR